MSLSEKDVLQRAREAKDRLDEIVISTQERIDQREADRRSDVYPRIISVILNEPRANGYSPIVRAVVQFIPAQATVLAGFPFQDDWKNAYMLLGRPVKKSPDGYYYADWIYGPSSTVYLGKFI